MIFSCELFHFHVKLNKIGFSHDHNLEIGGFIVSRGLECFCLICFKMINPKGVRFHCLTSSVKPHTGACHVVASRGVQDVRGMELVHDARLYLSCLLPAKPGLTLGAGVGAAPVTCVGLVQVSVQPDPAVENIKTQELGIFRRVGRKLEMVMAKNTIFSSASIGTFGEGNRRP